MRRIIRGFVEDIVLDPLQTFTFIELSDLFSEEHDNIYIFYRPLPKRFICRFVELIETESSALLTQDIVKYIYPSNML